jgi:hypothetical protein
MWNQPVAELVAQLTTDAQWWVKHLSPAARIEIDRLLRETGPANFTTYWREHKADLDELERCFGARL